MSVFRIILVTLSVIIIACAVALIATSPDPLAIAVPLGIGGPILAVIIWAIYAVRVRRRRATLVLNYLEQAVRLNLPLPRIVAAMREQEGGSFGRDLAGVQDALERGAPIASVLAILPEIPSRIVALTAAAERVGRLPQVLGRVMEERRIVTIRRAREGRTIAFRSYPLFVGLMLVFVTMMYLVFVLPKFEQIFKDFKLQLPRPTIALVELARNGGPWIGLLIAAALVLYVGQMLLELWQGPGNGYRGFGWPTWALDRAPLIGRMRMHRALGDVFAFAADALESGRTIEASMAEAGQVVVGGRLRPRIDRWVAELVGGRHLADAARAAEMPRLVSGMLAIPQADERTIVETFRFLGRYYSNRFSRAAMLLEAFSVPLFAIVAGLFVLWVALAIFTPMISLIQSLSTPTGRYPVSHW